MSQTMFANRTVCARISRHTMVQMQEQNCGGGRAVQIPHGRASFVWGVFAILPCGRPRMQWSTNVEITAGVVVKRVAAIFPRAYSHWRRLLDKLYLRAQDRHPPLLPCRQAHPVLYNRQHRIAAFLLRLRAHPLQLLLREEDLALERGLE